MEIVTDEASELKGIKFGLNLTRSCKSLVHNLPPSPMPINFPGPFLSARLGMTILLIH
jgi:hypothetical protein